MKGPPEDLKTRTKRFALQIVGLYGELPKTAAAHVLGRQMLRAGTSVGAHYREATRGRSNAEFVSKIEVGLQELEETVYWMELMAEGGLVRAERLAGIMSEADELTAILVSCVKRVKSPKRRPG